MRIFLETCVYGAIGALVVLLALGVLGGALIWVSFVLQKLWMWFLVPLGLPKISLANAIGIKLAMTMATNTSLLRVQAKKEKKKADDQTEAEAAEALWEEQKEYWAFFLHRQFLFPLTTLGIGWIVLQFMS